MDPGSEATNPAKLAEFLRWQALRVGGPLREITQDPSTGPIRWRRRMPPTAF